MKEIVGLTLIISKSFFFSLDKYQSKNISDIIWDFGKLPFPTHLGKYLIKIEKKRAKIHEIGKIKAIFGLGMTPIYSLKNGQIKSLNMDFSSQHIGNRNVFTKMSPPPPPPPVTELGFREEDF